MELPAVFISYSHDSPEHEAKVLALANRLRADGIDAVLDQYESFPLEGWELWQQRQIQAARFVLMVCTPAYRRRYDGEEEPGKGLGATSEAGYIRQLLYNAGGVNELRGSRAAVPAHPRHCRKSAGARPPSHRPHRSQLRLIPPRARPCG